MKEHKETNIVDETVENKETVVEPNLEAKITIVKHDSEVGYAIVDGENIIPCDKLVPYQGRTLIHLPSNSANRVWIDKKRVDDAIAAGTPLTLAYKASIKMGQRTTRIPNEQLVKTYCSEEEYNEYVAIFKKAQEAMLADKKKPLSEAEKTQAAIDKLMAKLAKLEASAANKD